MITQFTRKKFYELVWSKPLTKITEELEIDYHTIVALCKKHDIPRPPSNYWLKLKFGKQAAQPELPNPDDERIIWGAIKEEQDPYSWIYLRGKALEKHIKKEIEEDQSLDLNVSQRLSKPDRLVEDYLRIKEEREKARKRGQYLSSYDNPTISINSSKEQKSRALRFIDCLIKNLRLRGHHFEIRNYHYEIYICGVSYPFSLREVNKRVPRSDGWGSDYIPTGKLALKIDSWRGKEWQDQKTLTLEHKISEIIARLEYLAKKERAESIYRDVKHQRNKVESEKAEALKRKRIEEDQKFEKLLQLADQWKRVENLKEFILILENNRLVDSDKEQVIQWAKNRIEKLDFIGSIE